MASSSWTAHHTYALILMLITANGDIHILENEKKEEEK